MGFLALALLLPESSETCCSTDSGRTGRGSRRRCARFSGSSSRRPEDRRAREAVSELERPLHRVGALLETFDAHPGRSGRNHLRVLARAAEVPSARVDELLELVELGGAARRRVKGYSLGMRQRLNLAAALLGDPEVLVLDEPANGLDPQGIRWLRDLLRAQAAEGRTVLISSHVLAEIAQTVDQVVIIHRGRLVRHATMAEVDAMAAGATRVRTPDEVRLASVLAQAGFDVRSLGDGLLAVSAPQEKVGELAAEHRIVLHELTAERATLEDVFLSLTGSAEEQEAAS